MPYESYSAVDLAMDQSFQVWVLQENAATGSFWDTWLAKHPEKQPVVEQAKALVMIIQPRGKELSEQDFLAMKQAIERQTQEEQPVWNSMHRTANLQYKHRLFTTPAWYRLAAVFIGLLMLCGLYLWFANTPDIVYRTRYGQTATIILPDKSSVTLNGNSSLRYSNNWNVNKPREVWLEGEAFFSVVHKSNDETFTVYTRDAMNVQVLGTQFNVTSREGITQVVLSSGKVRLDMPANASRETLLMESGELVEFNASKAQYSKKQVDTRQYIAWKDNILIFDNTSLKEIAGILHHTYGLQVTIKDTTLWKETISGSVPSQDVSVILAGLAKSFNLTFTQSTDKKEVIISQ